jgi:sugar lactone lactonase YvrE
MPNPDPGKTFQAALFYQAACTLGEGPFWFQDRLWWVDIEEGYLHTVDGEGKDIQSHRMGGRIGSCAPIDDDHFVVALQQGIGVWSRQTGAIKILASPESDLPNSRFNEGKCDPRGRFLAGTLNMAGKEKSSALYSLGGDASLKKLVAPVSISNGLAWSRDGRTLYYIDTPTCEVAAFAYDLETGSVGDKRVVIQVPAEAGYPDGMDIDQQGNLWIAHWDGWAVRCWSPVTGQCLAEIRVPCQQPTSCRFGGPHYDQLFITSARVGLSSENLESQPLAGSVFIGRPGTQGFPLHACGLSSSL